MNQLYYYTENTESTNNLLKELSLKEKLPEGYVVYTDFQTAGKGQPGNSWESEKGKNLLFSILLFPQNIPIQSQFILSQITCVAIKKCWTNTRTIFPSSGLTIFTGKKRRFAEF